MHKVNFRRVKVYGKKEFQFNWRLLLFVALGALILLYILMSILNNVGTESSGNVISEEQGNSVKTAEIRFAIETTDTEHLDSEKGFISDISKEVKYLDNNWSETISDGEYARVTFEENLTNGNDIKIYPRIVSGNPKVEVYEKDGTNLIAEFANINDNQYDRVLLTNLQNSQNTFDLKILGGSVEFDHVIDPATVTNFQSYFAVLNFTNSTYIPFTGGQTQNNSVPFVTLSMADEDTVDDDWSKKVADVYFNSTGIIIQRFQSGNASNYSNMTVRVNVVQFASSSVRVQNGTFSLNSASVKTVGATLGTSVNTSRTAMVFYYNSTDATDDYVDNTIRANITNSTFINFTIDESSTSGTKAGHWYVFESLDGGFTVQNVYVALADTATTSSTIINSVQTNKTFLIASYITTESSDDPRDGSFTLNLTNSTAITAYRTSAATAPAQINATVFVITFTGNEFVQRGSFSYAVGTAIKTAIITSVNTSLTMAWNPILTGRMWSTSGTDALESGSQHLNITNSTAITGKRDETAGTGAADWEVITWVQSVDSAPQWSNNATNGTTIGTFVQHSVQWADDIALSGYIFSFNNGSGSFTNDSFVTFSGTTNFSNVSKWVNTTTGSLIQWRVFANDSTNNVNSTSIFNYTTTNNNPQWANNATNATTAGALIQHSINWTDDIALSGYIFSFANRTGVFVNDSFVVFSGVQNWSNVSKWVNTTTGSLIQWQVFANDSSNKVNSTSIFNYTTVADNNPQWANNATNATGGMAWNTTIAVWDGPSSNFSVAAQEISPNGIFFNSSGTKMFITGGGNGSKVFQYTLSQAWNISSATWDGPNSNFSVDGQATLPAGIFFNSTGTKMFVGDRNNIYQYTLSQPWNTSSAVWDGPDSNFSVLSDTEPSISAIFFNSTGTKMFVIDYGNDFVYQFNLSQAWNVSTAVLTAGSNLSIDTEESLAQGLFFDETGTKMIITGYGSNKVFQYTLSQPWNTSSATYNGAGLDLDILAQNALVTGIFFNATGTKMFTLDNTNARIYSYTVARDDNSNAGKSIQHSVKWTDETALSGYIFSFNNGSGSFTNDSFVLLSGTTNFSNVSKVVNTTVGSTIQWWVWANDSSNKINTTNFFSYATTDSFPQWSNNATNSTFAGSLIQHSVKWTDNTNLSGYIFSFDNGSGSFTNDSFVLLSGTTNFSNVSKVVNTTTNTTIRWRVFANDSLNQMNYTSNFTYNTTLLPPSTASFQSYFTFLDADVNSSYIPFTGGQTGNNAVPFVTLSIGDSDTTNDWWQRYLADVYFNSTGIIVKRYQSSTANMTVRINVVEFDSDSVRVQSGVFSLDSTSTKTVGATLGTSVNTSRSALIFYYNSTDATDDWQDNFIRGNITNSTFLNFSVDPSSTTGIKSGHWYVFESLDGNFTVQNKYVALGDTATTSSTIIDSVQTNKTFLIASYSTSESSDDSRDGAFILNLTNSTAITAYRTSAATAPAQINATVFVITFTGNEFVQRGSFSYAASDLVKVGTITSVNTSTAMAWNPILTGVIWTSGTNSPQQESFQHLNITNSTAITGARAEAATAGRGDWEVIQWSLSLDRNPQWANNVTNETTVGKFIQHSVQWTDDIALSGYIFSFNNGSGSFTNDTFVLFSGTTNFSNVSKWVNTTSGSLIQWRVFANDSTNQINATNIFNYTTTTPLVNQTHYRWRNDDGNESYGWVVDGISYTNRRLLTINESKIDANLTELPVRVSLASFPGIDLDKFNPDGNDIRFTKYDGTTVLQYERESFNQSADTGEVWVKVPVVNNTPTDNNKFYIYYRSNDTSDGQNASGVWNSDYKAVYHLSTAYNSTVATSVWHLSDSFSRPFVRTNDTNGSLHVFYAKNTTSGGTEDNLSLWWAVSRDGGATWNETKIGGDDGKAILASATVGTNGKDVHFLYSYIFSATIDDHYMFYRNLTWNETSQDWIKGSEETVHFETTGSNGEIADSNLIVDSQGIIHATWLFDSGSATHFKVYYKKRNATGWDANPTTLAETSGSANYPLSIIQRDSSDNLYVVSNINGSLRYRNATTTGNGTWTWWTDAGNNWTNITGSDYADDWIYFNTAMDANNRLHVVWGGANTGSDVGRPLEYARKNADSTWETTITLDSANKYHHPGITAYNDTVYLTSSYMPGSSATGEGIFYKSTDAGTTFGSRMNITNFSNTASDTRFHPRISLYGFKPAFELVWRNGTVAGSYIVKYRLDEEFDSTSNSHIGNVINQLNTGVAGQIARADEFDGVNNYIDAGNISSNVKTVSFWVYPTTTTEYFININSTSDYIWVNSGNVTATGFSSPTIYVNGVVNSTLSAGQWQHVTVTTDTSEPTYNLTIGRTAGNNTYYQGIMDEVRLSQTARSSAWVKADFNSGNNTLLAYGSEENFTGGSSATWKAAEDTNVTSQQKNTNIRLRFSLENYGQSALNYNYRLQVAAKDGASSCENVASSNFSDVPTVTLGCGSEVACINSSVYFSDQDGTTRQLSIPGSFTFVTGKMVEDPSNQTNSINLSQSQSTEVEYNFYLTNNAASNTTYCFRVANGNTALNNYTKVAMITSEVSDSAPQWSNNATNSTFAGSLVKHSVQWTDETALSGYIFSFANRTGVFVNDSFVVFSGTTNFSNVSKVANTTSGVVVQWMVFANDSTNQFNATSIFNYTTTTDASPQWNNASVNDSNPLPLGSVVHRVNWTDETALSYATLEVNGTGASCSTTANVSSKLITGTANYTNLTWQVPNECEGKAIGWKQYANDSSNNWNSTSLQTYSVQNVNPLASFGTNPVDNLNSSSGSISFELKGSDNLGVSFLRLYGNWSGTFTFNQTNTTPVNDTIWNVTVSGISEGRNHKWAVWVNDSSISGNQDFTDTNRTFTVDLTNPTSTINSPPNNTNTTDNTPDINVTVSDNFDSSITANIYLNGTLNKTQTISNNTSTNITLSEALSDSLWLITAEAVDDSGRRSNSSMLFLKIDTITPLAQFVSPTEASGVSKNQNFININVTATDTNLDKIVIRLYNSTLSQVRINESSSSPFFINYTGLADGLYYYNATSNDSSGSINNTETRNITLDTVKPNVQFVSPTTATGNFSQNFIEANVTATDTNLNIIKIYLYNSTGLVNSSTNNTSPNFFNFTGLPDGTYYLNATANDTAGNTNQTENRTIVLDDTNPLIQFVVPTAANGTSANRNWIFVNVTITEANFQNVTFSLFNSTGLLNSTTFTDNRREINWTGLSNMNILYWYNVSTYDAFGNSNQTETRYINLTQDQPPTVTILYPQNTTYNVNVSELNYTATDDVSLSACWYSLNGGANSTANTSCANFSGLTSNEGSNTWTVYANDSSNQIRSASVTFFKDTINPSIQFVATTETSGSYKATSTVNINVTATDTNLDKIVIRLYNSTLSQIKNNLSSTSPFNITYSGLADGIYFFNATANDTATNSNSTETRNVTIDTVKPNVQFVSPTTATGNFSQNFIEANVTATDTNLDKIVIRLYNSTNHLINSSTTSTSPNFINFTGLADGTYYLNATANDTAGNTNQTENRTIVLDTTNPNVQFVSPTETSGSYDANNVINVNVTATSTNLDEIVIRLYNSTFSLLQTNTSSSSPFSIAYDSLDDGVYYFNATANDTAANSNSTETRNVTIDTTIPLIDYTTGTAADNANLSQAFVFVNVTITEANFQNVTFSLFNSTGLLNSTTFTDNRREINFTSLPNEVYTYNVTTFDKASNAEITVTRTINLDTVKPNVDFDTPTTSSGNFSQNFIQGEVIATDTNLDKIVIRLYNSTNQQVSSSITSSSPNSINFSSLADGTYYLNATSNDTANNENQTETRTIILDTTNPSVFYNSNTDANSSFVNRSWIFINITVNDTNKDTVKLSWNGVNQSFTTNSGNFYWENKTSLSDGSYNFYAWVNDSVGNVNSTETRNVTVDTTIPLIQFVNPTEANGSQLTRNFIQVNVTASDTNLGIIALKLYNLTSLVQTNTSNSSPLFVNFTNLPESEFYFFNATINDSAGNTNQTETRKVSYIRPNLTIIRPENETYFSNISLLLNFSVSMEDAIVYNIDNTTNITIAGNTTFNTTSGQHTLYLFANNSVGTTGKIVTFTVNITKFKVIYSDYKNNGSTTEFNFSSYEDAQNLSGVVLEKTTYGKINFNQEINLTNDSNSGDNTLDLDSNVNISANSIIINSTAIPNFNKSATLSLYGLTFSDPRALIDGEVCPSTICTEVSYSGGTFVFNVTQFSNYSAEETPVATPSSSGGGGSSGGGVVLQCVNDSSCGEDESCIDGSCVKLFDIEIVNFKSPAKLGEFFDFTYYVKTLAAINNDVVISFWIEKNGEKISSGSDTIYLGTVDEKTKNSKIFLPNNFKSGIYNFVIEVSYQGYHATSQRTIEIQVKEGVVSVSSIDFSGIKSWVKKLIIPFLLVLIIFSWALVIYKGREKIISGLSWIEKLVIPSLITLTAIALVWTVYKLKDKIISGLIWIVNWIIIAYFSWIKHLIIPFLIVLAVSTLVWIIYKRREKISSTVYKEREKINWEAYQEREKINWGAYKWIGKISIYFDWIKHLMIPFLIVLAVAALGWLILIKHLIVPFLIVLGVFVLGWIIYKLRGKIQMVEEGVSDSVRGLKEKIPEVSLKIGKGSYKVNKVSEKDISEDEARYKQKIVDYLKKSLEKGYPEKSLKWALIKRGYSKSLVNSAAKKAKKEIFKGTSSLKKKKVQRKPISFEEILEEIKDKIQKKG